MRRSTYTMRMAVALAAGILFATATLAQSAGDAARGETLAGQTCVACHGADGNGPVPSFPKLAGLHADYLVKQLQEFKNGRRDSEVMKPIVAALSNQDMADVAAFFAAQRPAPGVVADAGVLDAGRKLYDEGNPASGVPACAGCHGGEGLGNSRFPHLAGQYPDYVLGQMKQFADGKRKNDKRVMQAVAGRMTADETHAVAQYIASLAQ